MSSPQVDGIIIGNAPNGELNWDLFMNPNLVAIGLYLARQVKSVGNTSPPAAITNDRHFTGVGCIGLWNGHDKQFAQWNGVAWIFFAPPNDLDFFNAATIGPTFGTLGRYTITAGAAVFVPFTPGGSASGDLTGTYPGPAVANLAITAAKMALNTITDGQVAPANKDGAVGLVGMRSLGPGALQAKPGAYSLLRFPASSLDSPLTADWAVNAFAPASADTANSALIVRRFDDTIEEGAGFQAYIPANALSLKISLKSRAQTAPPGVRTVGSKLYYRRLQDNTAISAWSSLVLNDISIPVSLLFQDDTQTILLASFAPALVADSYYQFEYTRRAPAAGTNLVGDWDLWNLMLEFN